MSTRASYASGKVFPDGVGWHLYRALGQPGEPLYLSLSCGPFEVDFRVPQELIDALKGERAEVLGDE